MNTIKISKEFMLKMLSFALAVLGIVFIILNAALGWDIHPTIPLAVFLAGVVSAGYFHIN